MSQRDEKTDRIFATFDSKKGRINYDLIAREKETSTVNECSKILSCYFRRIVFSMGSFI